MAAPRAVSRIRPRWLSAIAAVFLAVAVVAPTQAVTTEAPQVGLTTRQFDMPAQPPSPGSAVTMAQAAVVKIDTNADYQGVVGNGAGILLDPSGVVLTNFHVVQGADRISATNIATGGSFPGQLIGYDRRSDIAVVQLQGASGLPTAQIGDSGQVAIGEQIVTIGNAGGGPGLSTSPGSVAAVGRSIIADDTLTGSSEELNNLIEVAADVRAGDSGGALVNSRGQVIGVVVAASVNYRVGTPGGKGFAIPINDAMAIANQIRARAPSDAVHIGAPAMLGVGVSSAEGAGGTTGVLIRDVLPGTPAERAGLASGDVIVTIDGSPIDSANALTNVLDRHYPGDVVDVTWISRSGQQTTAKVPLMPGPDG